MKRILLGLLCALPLAAEPLTFERLISSVETEPAVQAGEKKRKAIQSGTSTKLWNSLELQYKLDGFGFMEHDLNLGSNLKFLVKVQALKNIGKPKVLTNKVVLIFIVLFLFMNAMKEHCVTLHKNASNNYIWIWLP